MKILSGGAAAAVVRGVQDEFTRRTGASIEGTFSAVGQMRDVLLAGESCDLAILTRPLIDGLIASGHVQPGSAKSLGMVKTGVAVRAGEPHPVIGTREQLKQVLQASTGIYFPDPEKATAGIHFMRVLTALGLNETCSAAFRTFPNGATAMGAMASSQEPWLIGCTQVTEINYTPGVELVGLLPPEFEMNTDYTLGICTNAKDHEQARVLAELLTGNVSEDIRKRGGFEF